MFNSMIGSRVTVVVSSRGDTLLEYVGTLTSEDENSIELTAAGISHMLPSFQKGMFGSGLTEFKGNVEKVIINKRYIISCNR